MDKNNHQQLEKILQSMAKEAKPDKSFEQMLKVKLRERFHAYHESKSTKIGFWNRFKIQLSSAFVLAIFASTTMYAYASDDITNSNILYPLKITAEKVEGIFAASPEAKMTYYNKMAGRRMRELAVLEKRGIKDEVTIRETDNLLAKAELAAKEVPDQILPIQPTPIIQPAINSGINLAKTKREKALEEITAIRSEFKNNFDEGLFPTAAAPAIEITPAIKTTPAIQVPQPAVIPTIPAMTAEPIFIPVKEPEKPETTKINSESFTSPLPQIKAIPEIEMELYNLKELKIELKKLRPNKSKSR